MFTRPVLYPKLYPWLLLGAALDVMLTWVVLTLGGRELNSVADAALNAGGLPAMLALKFSMIACVVILCEIVGRHRMALGSSVATFGVGVHAMVVAFTICQLVMFTMNMSPVSG